MLAVHQRGSEAVARALHLISLDDKTEVRELTGWEKTLTGDPSTKFITGPPGLETVLLYTEREGEGVIPCLAPYPGSVFLNGSANKPHFHRPSTN